MKRRIGIFLLALLMVLTLMPVNIFAESEPMQSAEIGINGSENPADFDWSTLEPGVDYVEGEMVVTFVDDLESQDMIYDIACDNGFTVIEILGFYDFVMGGGKLAVFSVPDGMTVPDAIDKVEEDPRVQYATPNGRFGLASSYTSDNYSIIRIYGNDRYETAFAAANRVFSKYNRPLEEIVIANGQDFPDALSSTKITGNNKPLILTSNATEGRTLNFIQKRVKSGGTIYLVGGTGVISQGFENTLKQRGYTIKRLGGKDRYETNLLILKEVKDHNADYVTFPETLVVVSGKDFADALSASPCGGTMMLVGDKLTEGQKQYLDKSFLGKILIIGGTGAVSSSVEQELKAFAPIERIGGADRYETSELVATNWTVHSNPDMCFVSGSNFADGIVAGAFARSYGLTGCAPVILVSNERGQSPLMSAYIDGIYPETPTAWVFGGPTLIKDKTMMEILEH